MPKPTTIRFAAGAALLALATPAFPQTQDSGAIGTPALQNFDLRGERVVPDRTGPVDPERNAQPQAQQPQPQAQTAAPVQQPPQAAPVRLEPAPPPVSRGTATTPTLPSRQGVTRQPPIAQETASAAAPAAVAAPSIPPAGSSAAFAPDAVPPAAMDNPALPVPVEAPAEGWPIWPLAGGILALVLAAYAFGRRNRAAPAPAAATRTAAPVPAPQPGPMPVAPLPAAPRPAGRPAPGPRAEIELIFEPTSTVLGDKDAIVHFILTIHNRGAIPARNVRLEARVFNAGNRVDADIGAFFSQPLQRRVVPLPEPLPSGERFGIQGEVPIPVADITPLEIEGRRLFIPIVAVTAIYEWEGGSGQTSKSYMVGVEAQQTGKMGAFRLDQGPRVYRSVGQREHRLAHIA
ncbi:hypothetical protein IC614_05455 [Allosphingosinicella flava]|uniref:Uncharacterized protein n=1 Tax=Allosphingosinicella flava TaxID=2771430 RepID=A0A7T2GLE3_9SPHN|nr:hypothetical protein [Sphingosinicella flava]QPQ56023.1 hypothetical protein IC614_05455 [Sphingosinicella flava]